MPGPGEYRPDPSQGITRIEDLPKPKIRCQSRNYRRRPCPRCGQSAYRDRRVRRTLHDLGNPLTGRPRELIVIYSQHCCTRCRKYFNADMTDLAAPGSHSTKRVVDTAVRLVIEDGLPYRAASWSLWRDHRVFVPYATIQNWVEDVGEKAQRRIPTDYLDWALSDFSGYIAADELYDGPFCVLSIVDNRTFKRLSYHVLDRDPTQVDIEAFFRRFRQALEARGLTVQGITTDGSTLYPEPIAAVFGAVPHQVCQFHILHEVNKAILSAVAQERKRLAAGAPKLPRGRPSSKAAKRAARRKKRIKQKVGELFAHRYLFVQRRLSPSERATLQRICRGWPQLRKPARADGGGLPVVRSAVPDGHSVGQAGEAAGAVAAVRPAAEGAQEAAGAGVGEGPGVLGRAAAGRDVQRGGAWQSSLPQDAEDGVPGSDAAGDRGPAGAGPAAGAARPRPGSDHQDSAQGEGGMMR